MARLAAADREARNETRRAQILDAAVRVWRESGFEGTPVEAIAREAGLGKGTLYLYFPTKEAILEALVERYSLLPDMEELADALRETPPDRAIPLIAARFYARLCEHAPLVGFAFRELSLRPRDARLFLERVMLPVNRLLASYLDGFVERGVLRPLDSFVAARALVGMLLVFVLSQHVFGGEALRPIAGETVVETVQELFLRGMLAPGKAS